MANSTSDSRLVGRGFTGFCARFAHGFVREQVLALLAPVFLMRHGRTAAAAAVAVEASVRGARHSVDLYASRVGRS